MPVYPLIFLVVAMLLGMTTFWISQLIDLMASPDDRFPGRPDKLIWAAAMIVWSVFGSLAYWLFKSRLAKL
jgi:hypothetical protein